MSFESGTHFGPYELLEPLGKGGMGEVYRGRDKRLGRDVAIKVVRESYVADASALARFDQEARLVGSLNHPNVLMVFDVGLHEGTPFLVTELLKGETLRDRLARGAVPLAQVVDWGAQIASGLAAAHAQGIVHRDLKPENVFITQSGQVKLLDFGVAKLAASARVPSPHDLLQSTVTPSGGMTQTGAVVGTARYMSPEQVRGEPVDARTDLFSFGLVLYEMLAGNRAFPAGSAVEVQHAILHEEPLPLPAEVPKSMVQLLHHCLEKDSAKRFQSARDLAFNLELLNKAGNSLPVPAARRSRWRRWLVLPFAAAGLLLAAFYAGSSIRREQPASIRPLTFRRGDVIAARFAPDGHLVYFSASWNGEPPGVYSTTTRSPDYHSLDVNDAMLKAVSVNGELAVIQHPETRNFLFGFGTLARVPGVGGTPRKIAEDVLGADWAPDGDDLAALRQVGPKTWLEFPLGHTLYESLKDLSLPRLSPRGDRVALVEGTDYGSHLIVVDRSGRRQELKDTWGLVTGLAWAPGGEQLWVSGGPSASGAASLWAVSLAGTRRLLYQGTGSLALDDVGRDGRALVREVERRYEVAVLSTDGQGGNEHFTWFDSSYVAGLSADGQSVLLNEEGRAAALFSEKIAGRPISWAFLQRTDGSPPVRLAEGFAVALSPDGKLALACDGEKSYRLWLLPTGPGAPRSIDLPGLHVACDVNTQFFGDGKRVAFLANQAEEALRAYVVDLETGKARAVTPALECCALQLSPDGRFLAAVPHDGGTTAYPVDEGSPRPFKGLGPSDSPVGWSKRGLLVSPGWMLGRAGKPPLHIFRIDIETGARQLLMSLNPKGTAGTTAVSTVHVTPDEKTVAYTYKTDSSTLYLFEF